MSAPRHDEDWLVGRLIAVFRTEAPGHLPAPRQPSAAESYAAAPAEVDFPDIYRELRLLGN